jgi:ribonucleoside-diphosphate reductase alpha chain
VAGARLPVGGSFPVFSHLSFEAKEYSVATLPSEPIQSNLSDVLSSFPPRDESPLMHVRKRNGALEPADVNKIVRAVQRCAHGLPHVDSMRIASKTIGGLYDGATTRELDTISIDTAAALIAEEPQYSRLAARLLLGTIAKEVAGQNLYSFSQAVAYAHSQALSIAPPPSSSRHMRASSIMQSMTRFLTALNISDCVLSMTGICCAIQSHAV